jgi:hypothetical protein
VKKLKEHFDMGVTYRSDGIDWDTASIIVVSDASHAGEEEIFANGIKREPYRSQAGSFVLLANESMVKGDREVHSFHLLEWGSRLIRRVCRSTLQAESYALTSAVDSGNEVRILLHDLAFGGDKVNFEDRVRHGRRMHWVTDCMSLYQALSRSDSMKITDKRLAIDVMALRQDLWRSRDRQFDPMMDDSFPEESERTDMLHWVDTKVMLSDGLTKYMDTSALRSALREGLWSFAQPPESKMEKLKKSEGRRMRNQKGPIVKDVSINDESDDQVIDYSRQD